MSTSISIPPMNLFLPVIASMTILLLWPADWGGVRSFIWSMPVIVVSAITLGYRLGNSKYSWIFAAFLLLMPPIGVSIWTRQIMLIDIPYLLPHESVPHFMTLVQRGLSPGPPIILGAWISSFWFRSPPARLILGLTAFSTIFAKHYIDSASIALHLGELQNAAHQLRWAEFLRLIPLAGLVVIWRDHNFRGRILVAIFSLICAWLVAPPLWLYLYQIPIPKASKEAPVGNWGTTAGVPSANPISPNFASELDKQGLQKLSGWPWWCNREPRKDWDSNRGATAVIRLDAQDQISTLEEQLPEILYRGVTRLGFIGKAEAHLPRPLGKHLERPLARFLLNPPPKGTYWGEVIASQAYFYEAVPADPVACALWVPPDVTIGGIFEISQTLDQPGGICENKLFMAFGRPPKQREVWKPPLPCEKAN